MKINDPEVRILAGISHALESEYQSEDRGWEGSPFAWIKTKPSRQVGAIGEKLVAGVHYGQTVAINFSSFAINVMIWPSVWACLPSMPIVGSYRRKT